MNDMKIENGKCMIDCFLCGRDFQHGQHRYQGRNAHYYGFMVCDTCWEANWDGWGPVWEPKIIAHLNVNGIPIPRRNEAGWLPRDL